MQTHSIHGKCASVVSHQHLDLTRHLQMYQDKHKLVLNVELQFKTIAPQTQLNQGTVHLAIHLLDAQMDSHVWHTTTLQPAHHAPLNLAVQLSVMILKFHYHMVFACLMDGGLLSPIHGKDSQMHPHTIT